MIEWKLPVKTISEANMTGEHWTKKHKRHQMQKIWIKKAFLDHKKKIETPCIVELTRVASRKIDSDNLSSAFKWIRDEIGAQLTGIMIPGRGDDDDDITWKYAQEKGEPKEYAIKIRIMGNP